MTGFRSTPAGDVPEISTHIELRSWLGTVWARLGARENYVVAPGLYAVGTPDAGSPVLVTANYKLTFDAVREQLAGCNVWLLVADTRGINVWCAAGKALFSTQSVSDVIEKSKISQLVEHRKVVLPQLGAPGVCAREVKKRTGFEVVYGPVRATDLPQFIASGFAAPPQMRQVTFTMRERFVLIPVEFFLAWRMLLGIVVAGFVVSGLGPDFFSLQRAASGVLGVGGATMLGCVGGCVLMPLFLPWIPGTMFSVKGAVMGVVSALPLLAGVSVYGPVSCAALMGWSVCMASFMGMNFSGSTPYTSPTGVEVEMKKSIPWLLLGAVGSVLLWGVRSFL